MDRNRGAVRWAARGLVVAVVLWSATRAQAQRPKRQDGFRPMPIKLTAQLVDFNGRDVLQVIDAQQQPFLAKIEADKTSVIVNGTADGGFLAAGQFVRFRATVADEKKGTLAGEVKELTIFTPRNENSIGAEPYRGEDKQEGELEIAGQLSGMKKEKFQVQTNDATYSGVISEEVKVRLQVADLSLCAPGMEVQIAGTLFEPGKIACDLVEVTLPEPLSSGVKKPKRPKARAKKPAADR